MCVVNARFYRQSSFLLPHRPVDGIEWPSEVWGGELANHIVWCVLRVLLLSVCFMCWEVFCFWQETRKKRETVKRQ